MTEKTVLITGASSGIGFALTKALLNEGYTVIAGARAEAGIDKLKQLAATNLIPILLDVTNGASIQQAFAELAPRLASSGLYALINNAGIAVPGPLEYLSTALLNQQFQVNVIGLIAVTQQALPYLRQAQGRIINLGSVSGRITGPFLGAYSASKFALRALNQALRTELHPWRIGVTLLEAGNFDTPIWQKGVAFLQDPAQQSPQLQQHYGEQLAKVQARASQNAVSARSPEFLVNVVRQCLIAKQLKPIYLVGKDAKVWFWLSQLLPLSIMERLFRRLLAAKGKPRKQ